MYVFTRIRRLATSWRKEGSFDNFEWLANDYERYTTEDEALDSIKRKALNILHLDTSKFIVYVAEIDDVTNKILKISRYIVSVQTEKMEDILLCRNWRCKK